MIGEVFNVVACVILGAGSDGNRLDEYMLGSEDTFEGLSGLERDASVRFDPCEELNNSEELGLSRSLNVETRICVELEIGLH